MNTTRLNTIKKFQDPLIIRGHVNTDVPSKFHSDRLKTKQRSFSEFIL
jgi:hypothetical protein